MKDIKKILFIVQARTNSERVPKKMIRPIGNTSLFEIFLNKIKQTNIPLNQFYASVFDLELKDLCLKHNINIFHRSIESRNTDNSLRTMYEWYDKFPQFKYAVLFNPCLLFLKPKTIDGFVQKYINSHYDGLFGVMEKRQYYWNQNKEMITPWPKDCTIMNTKIVEPTYEAAHALYAGKLKLIGKNQWMGNFKTNNPALYLMQEQECLDIDH